MVSHVRLKLEDVYHARRSNIDRVWGHKDLFTVIKSLCSSTRRCYDPCDYVYGVLGMIQINIPRMEDPNAVWRHFLSELDYYTPFYVRHRCTELADEIDLRKVENIGEVYHELIVRIFMFARTPRVSWLG